MEMAGYTHMISNLGMIVVSAYESLLKGSDGWEHVHDMYLPLFDLSITKTLDFYNKGLSNFDNEVADANLIF